MVGNIITSMRFYDNVYRVFKIFFNHNYLLAPFGNKAYPKALTPLDKLSMFFITSFIMQNRLPRIDRQIYKDL